MLLLTAWLVSGTRPFAETGLWAPIGVGIGLLYGGLVPAFIGFGDSHANWWQQLLLAGLLQVLPFGLATFGAMAWLDGSAYMYLMPWCLWTWVATVVIALSGIVVTQLSRRKPSA